MHAPGGCASEAIIDIETSAEAAHEAPTACTMPASEGEGEAQASSWSPPTLEFPQRRLADKIAADWAWLNAAYANAFTGSDKAFSGYEGVVSSQVGKGDKWEAYYIQSNGYGRKRLQNKLADDVFSKLVLLSATSKQMHM